MILDYRIAKPLAICIFKIAILAIVLYLSVHVILEMIILLLYRSADNKDYAPFPDRLLGSPWLNEHTAQSPPVDGRTLWLLAPDQQKNQVSFYRLTLTFLEYTYLKLPLLRSFYYTHG